MNKRSYLLLFILVCLLAGRPAAPRRDFSGQYRPGRRVVVDTRREADSLRLYLSFPDGNVLSPAQPVRIRAWASYDAQQPLWQDTIPQLARRTKREGITTSLEFCLPMAKLRSGQVLSIQPGPDADDTGHEAWILLTDERMARPFVLVDSVGVPLLRRYVHAGEGFEVSTYGLEQPCLLRRYDSNFSAALPPMTNPAGQPPAARTLAVRDSLTFQAVQLVALGRAGLYLLTSGAGGPASSLLVEENNFPEVTTAADLIQPLIYLTSSIERKKLYNAPSPKKAVDQFWLDAANGQQATARQLIRTYYGRVAAANRLFSSYKAGWMTDRGMLYVVMGPPDVVYRTGAEERWLYRQPEVGTSTYVFRAKPSTFAPEHYELVRRPEHEMLWYAAVEQWRKAPTTVRPGR
ncbi:GWxTD domain-containing protein [Hymenobacter sp. HD11105]